MEIEAHLGGIPSSPGRGAAGCPAARSATRRSGDALLEGARHLTLPMNRVPNLVAMLSPPGARLAAGLRWNKWPTWL